MPDHILHSLELAEALRLTESISTRLESEYLLLSNKEKCRSLLQETAVSSFGQEQAIDFLISLHIVLEVGLNTFFRHISLAGIKKSIHPLEISKNLDRINFIDKVVLFIYNSKFDFQNRMDEATQHHAIIGRLRQFSEARNKLLHGHSISTVTDESGTRHSEARVLTEENNIAKQIENFRLIMEGLRFYFDCLESSYTASGKDSLKGEYLCSYFLDAPAQIVQDS